MCPLCVCVWGGGGIAVGGVSLHSSAQQAHTHTLMPLPMHAHVHPHVRTPTQRTSPAAVSPRRLTSVLLVLTPTLRVEGEGDQWWRHTCTVQRGGDANTRSRVVSAGVLCAAWVE